MANSRGLARGGWAQQELTDSFEEFEVTDASSSYVPVYTPELVFLSLRNVVWNQIVGGVNLRHAVR